MSIYISLSLFIHIFLSLSIHIYLSLFELTQSPFIWCNYLILSINLNIWFLPTSCLNCIAFVPIIHIQYYWIYQSLSSSYLSIKNFPPSYQSSSLVYKTWVTLLTWHAFCYCLGRWMSEHFVFVFVRDLFKGFVIIVVGFGQGGLQGNSRWRAAIYVKMLTACDGLWVKTLLSAECMSVHMNLTGNNYFSISFHLPLANMNWKLKT